MPGPCPVVWLDGRLVDGARARIDPTDHAVTVGDGVFETLKITPEGPFALTRHLTRLRRGATAMGFELPPDDVLRRAAAEVCAANPTGLRLRLVVSSGPGPAGSTRGDGPATVLAFVDDSALPTGHARAVTVPWTRNEGGALAGLKTTSYAENVLAIARAREAGADEALFANTQAMLCEGTGSNVFVVIDDQLLTPPLSSGCLAGVTRELVLEAGRAVEADISIDDLGRVREAFLTSTTRDVQGVESIDGRRLPVIDGAVTRAESAAFTAVAGSIDP